MTETLAAVALGRGSGRFIIFHPESVEQNCGHSSNVVDCGGRAYLNRENRQFSALRCALNQLRELQDPPDFVECVSRTWCISLAVKKVGSPRRTYLRNFSDLNPKE